MVNFRFSAHTTSEFGEGPEFADMQISKDSIEQIDHDLQTLKQSGFDLGKKSLFITTTWRDEDVYRLLDESLTVTSDNFIWASARPKHADYDVETMPTEIELIKKLHKTAHDFDADMVDLHEEGPDGERSISLKKDGEVIAQDAMENIFGLKSFRLDGLIESAKGHAESTNLQPR